MITHPCSLVGLLLRRKPGPSTPLPSPPLPPARPNTTLFCGDLPPYWASADLLNFFSEYGEVLEARVIGSQVGTRSAPGKQSARGGG